MKNGERGASGNPILWIVIPCYNESAVLPLTSPLFLKELLSLIKRQAISDQSRIVFIDDGSKDGTWEIIVSLSDSDEHFQGIALSRNRGHQNALLAGLMEARQYCDVAISVDCDGQDDICAISRMVDSYLEGSEVVYGVRSDRSSDSAFKKISAEGFYRFMRAMGAESLFNHADYRLMSVDALDALSEYKEVNLFLRGMVPLVGFPSSTVDYSRASRVAGESHYPFAKMIHLALDGITSLSVKPIHIVSGLGITIGALGFLGTLWVIGSYLAGNAVSGWTSTACIILLLGGIQLVCLGVVGEYVGKIYLESKARPRYAIADRTWNRRTRHYKG